MEGQGRPAFPDRRRTISGGGRWLAGLLRHAIPAVCGLCTALLFAVTVNCLHSEELELELRVLWGGGPAQNWFGELTISEGSIDLVRDLGVEPWTCAYKSAEGNRLVVEAMGAVNFDGFDCSVRGPANALLRIELTSRESSTSSARLEIPLKELIQNTEIRALDTHGNRLVVRRSPADRLRVRSNRSHLIFGPGETFSFELVPRLLRLEPETSYRIRVWLTAAGGSSELWSWQLMARSDASGELAPVVCEPVPMPDAEGVYEIHIALFKRPRIEVPVWRNPAVLERSFQLVVLRPEPLPSEAARWREIAFVDMAQPTSRTWPASLPALPLLPKWDRGRPLATGSHELIQVAGRSMTRLGPRAWQAYPLTVTEPGVPHIVEIEYPGHLPQALLVSVLEPNAHGAVAPLTVDSAIYVPPSVTANPESVETHRLLFWPKTKQPLLFLANYRDDGPAVFGSIRLLQGPMQLPTTFSYGQSGERLAAAVLDRPLFAANFSADPLSDGPTTPAYDDWWKFYQGTIRLVQYLRYTGYNGAVVCVARDGSLLYPSRVWPGTPKYDTGIFREVSCDPTSKDVLELLQRVFDREGLRFIPAVHFSGRVPQLEAILRSDPKAAEGVRLRDTRGRTAPQRYNPLNERVQQFIVDVIDELSQRCAGHPSFQGVAISLGVETFVVMPDATWGFDPQTWEKFLRSLPPEDAQQARASPEQIFRSEKLTRQWLAWRADELARLFARCADTVNNHKAGSQIWLTTGDWLDGRSVQRLLRPALGSQERWALQEATLQTGIDVALYRQIPGLTLLRPLPVRMSFLPSEQAVNGQLVHSPEADSYFAESSSTAGRGVAIFHERAISRWPTFEEVSPWGSDKTRVELYTHAAPGANVRRRYWVHALAAGDAANVFDGGWLLPLGQEELLKPVLDVYRALPAEPFTLVQPRSTAQTEPVVVRLLKRGDRTYFYAVNDSPWPVTVTFLLEGPGDMRLNTLGQRIWPELEWREGTWHWQVRMAPYDLVGGWLSSPRARIVDWQVQLPEFVIPALSQTVRRVITAAESAMSRAPLTVLSNANFEETANNNEIPGWRFKQGPGLVARLDQDASQGRYSLYLKSEGDDLWVRSVPFDPPRTGRLYVLVRLRTRAAQQPQLRVILDDDQDFYYPLVVGASSNVKIPAQWGEDFLFPFEDLPLSRLRKIHLGFDLIGAGEVWIDQVQVYDLWIRREERNALVIAAGVAQKNLDQFGNVSECLRFLEGFWPQLLLGDTPATDVLLGPAVRTAQRESSAGEKTAEPSLWNPWGHVRDWVPRIPLKPPFRN
jgi:hypothetical protein